MPFQETAQGSVFERRSERTCVSWSADEIERATSGNDAQNKAGIERAGDEDAG